MSSIFGRCTNQAGQQQPAQGDEVKGKCGKHAVTALKVTAAAIAIAAVVFGVLAALQLNGIEISSGFAGFNAIGTTGAYALVGVGGGALIAYSVISAIKECRARRLAAQEGQPQEI